MKTSLHVRTSIAQHCWDLQQCSDNKNMTTALSTWVEECWRLHVVAYQILWTCEISHFLELFTKSYRTVSLIRMGWGWKQASYVYRLLMKQKLTVHTLLSLSLRQGKLGWLGTTESFVKCHLYNRCLLTRLYDSMSFYIFVWMLGHSGGGGRFTSLPSSKPQGWLLDPRADCIWEHVPI